MINRAGDLRAETAGENMLMSSDTHETARTQFVQVGDVRLAYRRFGRPGGLPLLLLNYFAANMDDWDPKVTNGFAAERDVILVDNAGVGRSTGETPSTVAAMTRTVSTFEVNFGSTHQQMTKLLAQALAAARRLPPEAQDDIAHVVLRLTGADQEAPVPLTPEEQAAVAASKAAAAARGEFATDEQVRAVWAKHGL